MGCLEVRCIGRAPVLHPIHWLQELQDQQFAEDKRNLYELSSR